MRWRLLLVTSLVLFLFSAIRTVADVKPKYFIRLYSDICFHAESGDLLGTRIIVLRLRDGDYVYFQSAEDSPSSAKAIIADNATDIEFHIIEPDRPAIDFKGKLTDQLLSGRMEYDDGKGNKWLGDPMRLPRLDNVQKGFLTCK
jgi:hypothetical protein